MPTRLQRSSFRHTLPSSRTMTLPVSGNNNPAASFSNVDLPLPFIPVTAVICPDKASAEKFLIIVLPSKHFVTPENVRRIMTSPLLPNSFLIELHPIRAACQNPLFLHQADLTGQRAPVAFQLFSQLDAARNTDLHRALMSCTLK